ncbi:hypothetical protein R1sor_000615 [Riccia sorocarpa]|uniref:Uncharacterized protein n=1 Tax=Riccia sorocarpa TaxID=122646 RepID=A0ABD3GTN0_9MARC
MSQDLDSLGQLASEVENDDDFVHEICRNPRFQDVDTKELENVEQSEPRRNKYSETWARRAFDEWRESRNLDISRTIEDLSEEVNLRDFIDNLSIFFLQVRKKDGKLYPPMSIEGLLRAIGRIIRARQKQRLIKSGAAVIPFNILKDVRYRKVKVAADEAVSRAMAAGLGKYVKKSDLITLEEEHEMLPQPICSLDSPRGLNYRIGYFCNRSGVFQHDEFQATNMVGYRTWPASIVFNTKTKFKNSDAVWFCKSPVGVNTLRDYMKNMVKDLPGTNVKAITNKSGRGLGITRMVEAGVPTLVAMGQTGHPDPKSFDKYDRSSEHAKNRVIQRIVSGEISHGRKLKFSDVFHEELEKTEGSGCQQGEDDGQAKNIKMLQENGLKKMQTTVNLGSELYGQSGHRSRCGIDGRPVGGNRREQDYGRKTQERHENG